MEHSNLDGKSLAVLLITDVPEGEEEEWYVISGAVRRSGSVYSVDRGAGEAPFKIQGEWLERIKPVPDALRDVLSDADFYLSLSVGGLPDDADLNEYEHTGLKLPE